MRSSRRVVCLLVALAGCNREGALPPGDVSVDAATVPPPPDAATVASLDLAAAELCPPRPAPTDCGPFAAACGNATVLATGSDTEATGAFAVDDRYLYWAIEREDHSVGCEGAIMRSDKHGGPATVLIRPAQPSRIVVDDTNLYWIEYGRVLRAPKTGGAPSVIATYQGLALEISVAGGNLYWTVWAQSGEGTSIWTAPAKGGQAYELVGSLPGAPTTNLVLDGDSLYWITESHGATGPIWQVAAPLGSPAATVWDGDAFAEGTLAAIGSSLFFVEGTNEVFGNSAPQMSLARVGVGGGPPVTVSAIQNDGYFLSEVIGDPSAVIWNENGDYPWKQSVIYSQPVDGGAAVEKWRGMTPHSEELVTDGERIYFFLRVGPPGGEIYNFRGGYILSVPR